MTSHDLHDRVMRSRRIARELASLNAIERAGVIALARELLETDSWTDPLDVGVSAANPSGSAPARTGRWSSTSPASAGSRGCSSRNAG